jgi:polyisoprenoid-binding protein YceI
VVDAASSAVLIDARSNMGRVSFGSTELSGVIEAVRDDDRVATSHAPTARLTVPMGSLTSGNALYDAELFQRLGVQRYPLATIELTEAQRVGGNSYAVTGTVSIHGVTSTLQGGVTLSFPEDGALLVTGEHVIDIRDFDIDIPSVLMLRIYPDAKVSLHLLAREELPVEMNT